MRRLVLLAVTMLLASVPAMSEIINPQSGLFTVNESGSRARLLCVADASGEGLQAPGAEEWDYILYGRSGSRIGKCADARFAVISVADTLGMLLVPDSFVWRSYMGVEPFVFNDANVSKVPGYTGEQRDSLLAGGCVFVPDGCSVALDGPVSSRIAFGRRPAGLRLQASRTGYADEGEMIALYPHSNEFEEVTAVYSVTRTDDPSVRVTVTDGRFVMPRFGVTVEVVYVMGMVDLGLPSGLKWASMNLGAEFPEDFGGFYSWGEVAPKVDYGEDSYFDTDYDAYRLGGVEALRATDDAARALLGGAWRLPAEEDWAELRRCCTWRWEAYGGRAGYRVTSKANGRAIFIPAAGRIKDTGPADAGSVGNYWTSELGTGSSRNGRSVHFSYGYFTFANYYRFFGLSVRPVAD